mgnify:CR=1 FL=1
MRRKETAPETHTTAVIELPAAVSARPEGETDAALLQALMPVIAGQPLLAAATEQGGRVDPASIRLSLLSRDTAGGWLRLGVFGEEVVGGCSCGDEPYAVGFYVELRLRLDPASGTAEIGLATA